MTLCFWLEGELERETLGIGSFSCQEPVSLNMLPITKNHPPSLSARRVVWLLLLLYLIGDLLIEQLPVFMPSPDGGAGLAVQLVVDQLGLLADGN